MDYGKSSSYLEVQLNEILKNRTKDERGFILEIASVVLSEDFGEDLPALYRILGLNDFIKVVSLFENRSVKFPTLKSLKDSLLLVLCYYYRETKGLSWEDIKKTLGHKFSAISFGLKISRLNEKVRDQIKQIICDFEGNDRE
ncbi:MAG: hypothetical protein GF311_28075 [Candidatus Lokiarchaeota archaeon]|nr:hypothetical protein [Candidatus Lokiarchaeota archaeon]